MSSAISFNLDQSKIMSSSNGLSVYQEFQNLVSCVQTDGLLIYIIIKAKNEETRVTFL